LGKEGRRTVVADYNLQQNVEVLAAIFDRRLQPGDLA
jgi:hypothetical protein